MTLLRKSLVPPKRKSSARVHNKQINFVLIYYAIQKQKDQIGLLLNLILLTFSSHLNTKIWIRH